MLLSKEVYAQALQNIYMGKITPLSFISSDREMQESYIAYCAKNGLRENEVSAAKFLGKEQYRKITNVDKYGTIVEGGFYIDKGIWDNYLIIDPDQIDIFGEHANSNEPVYTIPNSSDIEELRKIKAMCARLYRRGIDPKLILDAAKLKLDSHIIYVSSDYQVFIVVNAEIEEFRFQENLGPEVFMKIPIKIDLDALDRAVYIFFLHHPEIIYRFKNPNEVEETDGNDMICDDNLNVKEIKAIYDRIARKKKIKDKEDKGKEDKSKENRGKEDKGKKDKDKVHRITWWAMNSSDRVTCFSRLKASLIKIFGEENYYNYFIQEASKDSRFLPIPPERIKFLNDDYETYSKELTKFKNPNIITDIMKY